MQLSHGATLYLTLTLITRNDCICSVKYIKYSTQTEYSCCIKCIITCQNNVRNINLQSWIKNIKYDPQILSRIHYINSRNSTTCFKQQYTTLMSHDSSLLKNYQFTFYLSITLEMKGQVHCIVGCSFTIMANGYSMHKFTILLQKQYAYNVDMLFQYPWFRCSFWILKCWWSVHQTLIYNAFS